MPVFTEEELVRAEPLHVVAATPVGLVEGADEAAEIIVTFDDEMVALEAVPESVDFPLLIAPDIRGTCHWLGARTVAFRPDTSLPVATAFRVKIPRGVRSLAGRMLKQDCEFEFETVRPQLENSTPYHNQELVQLAPVIWLDFNVPMDPVRARRFIRLQAADGTVVPLRIRRPGRREQPPEHVWWYNATDSSNALVLEPVRRLRIQTRYNVVLESGLLAREGNLGTVERREFGFTTFNRFRFQGIPDKDGHHPEDPVEFVFSNPVPQENLLRWVKFRPEVRLPKERYSYATDHHYVYAELKPETTYEVVLSKWLSDKFGNRLGRDVRLSLRTVSFRPRVTMPTGAGIVETADKVQHPVWMVNVDSVAIRMRRLDAGQVIPFWRAQYEHDYEYETRNATAEQPVGTFTYEKMWKPGLARNKRTLLPLNLTPGLAGRRSGYLFFELDMLGEPERGSRYCRAFVQVTPFGLSGKFSPENGLGYVTRLSDCSAVADATVELRDDRNQLLWTGRTDRTGFVLFPGWTELGVSSRNEWSSPRMWMFVHNSEGEAFVHSDWGTGIYPYEFGVSYDWNPDPTEPTGFLFSEKGLYRQSDTVRLKGIIRDKSRGRWVAPSRREGVLTVTDPRDQEVFRRGLTLSGWGSFDVAVPLSADAVTGYYNVTFEQGERYFYGSFRVEAYRPAEFDVRVSAEREQYVAGDWFEATVSGQYLFGAPMAQDRVDWSIVLEPSFFVPPGHEGFTWGPSVDQVAEQTAVLASGSGRLDAEGCIRLKARLDLGHRTSTCRVTCEGTVFAANERSISGRESFLVHRADRYVGLKASEDFVELGDSLGLDVIAAAPEGRLLPGTGVTVTVFRRVWRSARKARTGGRYSWVSEKQDEVVGSFKLRTEVGPVRRWFKPTRPGYYWLKAEARDGRRNPVRTDLAFWVAGRGEAAWMMRDDDVVELVRDRGSYQPGDTARILVKSPWQNVKALVTVEREFVLDYFVTSLSGNAELVRVPVREEYLPNVFVSVMLFKGRTANNKFGEEGEDLGKPGFKIGYVELPVNPDAKKLVVKAETERDEYRPGEEIVVDLSVMNQTNSPVAAEVTVAVVDLGVLKLIGYETPDPFSVFYAPRSLAVATAESRLHVIGQRNYGEKGENAGGGGMDRLERPANGRNGEYEFAYRQRFMETALWLPAVRTDGNGQARVRFKLPDNLTTWQVMAVAATQDRFGSGEARFKTNKPLLLTASLPRFVRPEDRFSAGVMVHNRTNKKMTVNVRASCAKGAELEGETSRQVEVEPNQPLEVLFSYRCTGGTQAEFAFHASAGAEQDGLKLSLPVKNPLVTEAVAVYEQTTDTLAVQTLSAPADAFVGVGGLEVTVASSGLAGLERGLEYLRTYPYECLEQRLSKVLPFISGEAIINQFRLSELRADALRRFVQTELDLVPKYQDESGGFHFWGVESWSRPSPFLSAYCMYLLALARRNGYKVNSGVVELGKSYLVNWLGYGRRDETWPYSVDEYLTTRSLAVYALTLWDVNTESYVNALSGSLDKMSVFGKAYLLKTVALLPRLGSARTVGDRLIQAINNKLKLAPTSAHYEEEMEGGWIFHSNVRTTAVVLQALLEARGEVEFAEKVVKWLIAERKSGRWRTTQENAYVFGAMATFYRVYEKTRPDFVALVRFEGKTVLSQTFSGRSLAVGRRVVPFDSLAKRPVPVEVVKRGEGRLYYGLRLSYAPKGELKPADEGLKIEKTIRPLGKGSDFMRGEQYLVTLRVYTPQDRLYVVVDDPLPAGLEIVNTSFETEQQKSARLPEQMQEETGFYLWGDFDHEEKYEDRYVLFATYLRQGLHTKTYLVKALTRGHFFMPATKVEEMYSPEVFGRTGQQWVDIK
ncbi:MAG: alpha-2-macroglobulin family protein [candidate division WOR-3 bacterium]